MGLDIPARLRSALDGTQLEGAVLTFVSSAEAILRDNKTPFFPAYTDHGAEHVARVMSTVDRLVPDRVWEDSLLTDCDAAAFIAASVLHDLLMHLREPGFEDLVSRDTRFAPVDWFADEHAERPPDRPWPDAWARFQSEARHASHSWLDRVLGPNHDGAPPITIWDTETRSHVWSDADRLLVGEFLRRNHARLAHEVCIHGFPGLPGSNGFLGLASPDLEDAIGAIARSHNETLRASAAYFEYRNQGNLRPAGVLTTFVMAVLRIADYLQLDSDRAPLLLLQLKQPQSQVSLDEWNKHGAMGSISWDHKDPGAIYFDVAGNHSLRTHLQLAELFADVQREMDLSSAVLNEVYVLPRHSTLRLSRQRILSNLHEKSLERSLPYVPKRAALRSSEDLFRLVVGDLYGNQPAVAGRELLQNAADAVRERARWQATHGGRSGDQFFASRADIEVEVREHADGSADLRVADKGIGMPPQVVIDFFLQAGASLRHQAAEAATPQQEIAWTKAGRFGVGAFASFLLGPQVKVTTRHVEQERGVRFSADLNSDLVQLDWVDCPFGTEIVVPFNDEGLPNVWHRPGEERRQRLSNLLDAIALFYELREPHVEFSLICDDGSREVLEHSPQIPEPLKRLPDAWRRLKVKDYDAILWSLPSSRYRWQGFGRSQVAVNGLLISEPETELMPRRRRSTGTGSGDPLWGDAAYGFADRCAQSLIEPPALAVFDSRHRLGVSLTRYELTEETLEFEGALLNSIGVDIVGHAMAVGAHQHPLGRRWGLEPIVGRTSWTPHLPGLVRRYIRRPLLVLASAESHNLRQIACQSSVVCGWRAAPFRTVVELDLGRSGDPSPYDRRFAEIGDGFAKTTTRLAGDLGMRVDTAFVARPDGSGAASPHSEFWHGDLDTPGFHAQPNSQAMPVRSSTGRQLVVRRVESDDEASPQSHEPWIEVADFVLSTLRTGVVGVALLAPQPLEALAPLSPVEEPWAKYVDGLLERSEYGRLRRYAACGASAELKSSVNKWRRLQPRTASR